MATAIVRDRWQVTIPPQVRDVWVEPGSVLEWEKEDDRLVVEPYSKAKKKINWEKIWEGIRRCRSFKSQGKDIPASQFIIEDRNRH